jgi:putative tryptophan/tyrosine transport system substrate-binding protein
MVFAMAATLAAGADPPTIGIVAMGPQTVFRELPTYARFYARMRELGWREGENIRYVGRGAAGDIPRLDQAMQELARSGVAMIVTVGFQEALAAKRAAGTIPVVMVHPGDPVQLGVVSSLSRPGGNMTGNFSTPSSIHAKRAEVLSELVPGARRIHLGFDAPLPKGMVVTVMDEAAKRYRFTYTWVEIPTSGDYDAWLAKSKRAGADAMGIAHSSSAFRPERRKALAEALIRHRLPSFCAASEYVESGCLASYAPSNIEFFASAAVYADKILRGAKPADLPIQQPAIYEFVINMKTARALGISIPQSVLLRADRVIE